MISYDEFETVDFRSGTVVKVELFERVKKPTFKVWVDFGSDMGLLWIGHGHSGRVLYAES